MAAVNAGAVAWLPPTTSEADPWRAALPAKTGPAPTKAPMPGGTITMAATPRITPRPRTLQAPATVLADQSEAARNKRVIVIDDFTTRSINLNRGDTVPDTSHGELCARIAEIQLGRGVERVDVGHWGADDKSPPRFAAALRQLIHDHRGGDFSDVVLSISLASPDASAGSPDAEIKRLLGWLGRAGAQVFVAAGNEYENALCSKDVTCVGGTTGAVGSAPVATPSPRLHGNHIAGVKGNALVMTSPVLDPNGDFGGVSLNRDRTPEFKKSELTKVDARVGGIEGRRTKDAALGLADLSALVSKIDRMPNDARRSFDAAPYANNVIGLNTLKAVCKASGRADIGFPVPRGVDRSKLYVSATGVVAWLAGNSNNAQVVFFNDDGHGRLNWLGNNGEIPAGLGTSFSTPGKAAEAAGRPLP